MRAAADAVVHVVARRLAVTHPDVVVVLISVEERIEVIAPHPLARLKYDNVRVPGDAIIAMLGTEAGLLTVAQRASLAAYLGLAQPINVPA